VMTESQKVQAEAELKQKLDEAQKRLDAVSGNNLDTKAQEELAATESKLKESKAELVKCETGISQCSEDAMAKLEAEIQQFGSEKSELLNLDPNNEQETAPPAKKSEDYTPVIVAVVVVVVFAAIAAMVVVFVCKHRMYDEVYGSAGRGIYGGVYGNPVYAAQPGTVPPQGFMSTAAATDYKAQYQAPANTAAPKKGGLVRQESMC